jgi:hypothetical protein
VTTYPDTDKLVFQLCLKSQDLLGASDANKSAALETLDEARRIIGKGDIPTFVTGLPGYARDAGCGCDPNIGSCGSGVYLLENSEEIYEHMRDNRDNVYRGPNFEIINARRELAASNCHVDTAYFAEDGKVLKERFGR